MTLVANHRYNPAIDALRVIAILAVVLIHTSTRFLEVGHYDLKNLFWPLVFNQASRFAVPLFFLLSGFVLKLSYKNLGDYIKKRASRIIIPYLFWSLVYYFLVYTSHADNFWQALLSGSASYQLYFIPSLLILYVLFPVLHYFQKFFLHPISLIALGLGEWWLLYQDYWHLSLNIYFPVGVALLNVFVFVLGMALSSRKWLSSNWLALTIIPTTFLGYEVYHQGFINYYLTYNIHYIYSSFRPSVLLYTLCVGGFGYWLFSIARIPISFIQKISRLSFFVFFIHTWILEIAWQVGIRSGLFIAVTLVSFVMAYFVHKIHFAELVVG